MSRSAARAQRSCCCRCCSASRCTRCSSRCASARRFNSRRLCPPCSARRRPAALTAEAGIAGIKLRGCRRSRRIRRSSGAASCCSHCAASARESRVISRRGCCWWRRSWSGWSWSVACTRREFSSHALLLLVALPLLASIAVGAPTGVIEAASVLPAMCILPAVAIYEIGVWLGHLPIALDRANGVRVFITPEQIGRVLLFVFLLVSTIRTFYWYFEVTLPTSTPNQYIPS